MERENFFILLELPFDPPSEDLVEIKAAIHTKHREWSRMYDNPQLSSTALQYMELVPEIEEVLLDSKKRSEEAKKAIVIRDHLIPSLEAEIRLIESKGYIHPTEFKKILDKYKPFGIFKNRLQKIIHVPITDTPPKISTKHVFVPALPYEKVLEIKSHLDVIGDEHLYSFLNLPSNTSFEGLLSSATKKQHEAFHTTGKSGKTTATQKLAEISTKIFETENSKASYDEFLSVNTYPKLNDLVQEEFQRSGFISPEILMRLVNFGVTSYQLNVLQVEEYLRSYCAAYDITIDMAPPEITCPNCAKTSPRGSTFCAHCAAPLEGNCPRCNTYFSDGAAVCTSCSFSIGNMGKALPYIEKAETALIENNWSSAKHAISYIKQYWPGHPKLDVLESNTDAVEQRYLASVSAIESAISSNRYYAARELALEAEQKHILLPRDMVQNIHKTLEEFENQLDFMKSSGTESFESLNTLAGHVADSLELGRMMVVFPPEPPTRFTARPTENTVVLNWGKSPSIGNLEYIVVRKENSVPLTAYDGTVLYQGGESTFEDETIPPLKSYFYSVFVERSGSFSEMGAVAAAPVRIVPELPDFSITPGDSAAQLTWSLPDHLKEVKIWRTIGEEKPSVPEDGIPLPTNRIDGYTDMKLKNDVTYWYHVKTFYHTKDSGVMESAGITASITPHKLVSPIDHFSVAASQDTANTYFANWEGAPREEILFLHSNIKPIYQVGQMVEISTLLREFNRLSLEKQTPTSAEFQLRFNGGTYIFPVVISGKFGSVGSTHYLTNVPDVDQITYDIIESDLFVNFRWPSGPISQVTLAYRKDTFPNSLEQKGTTVIHCTREQYDFDAGVKIPEIEKGRYYLTIFSTFVSADDKNVYSTGEHLLVDNTPAQEFFYTLKYSKPFFSSHYLVAITIEGNHKFNLPKALLVGKEGQVPLSITDGNALFEVQREQNVAGSITFEYKTEKLPKNLYARLFFFDDEAYQRLRPIPGRSLRIT